MLPEVIFRDLILQEKEENNKVLLTFLYSKIKKYNKNIKMNEIKRFYDSNGYFFPINAVDNVKTDKAADKLINLSKNPPKNIKHPWNLQAHLLASWIYDLCISPVLLDAVEEVIGPNILSILGICRHIY